MSKPIVFKTTHRIAFSDLDPYNHVSTARYATYFIDHRIDVVRRRTAFLLAKAKDREHILEGYRLALDHIDNVIAIIRGSADRANARDNLIAYFAGKKIDINTTGRAPKLDQEKPFTLSSMSEVPR